MVPRTAAGRDFFLSRPFQYGWTVGASTVTIRDSTITANTAAADLGGNGGRGVRLAVAAAGSLLSPLVDQDSCPEAVTYQRGYGDATTGRRPVDHPAASDAVGGDGCDIGAVEVGADADADPSLFADGFEVGHTLFWAKEKP